MRPWPSDSGRAETLSASNSSRELGDELQAWIFISSTPNQFLVISHSVKKMDPNDARNLALYLAKGLLPEVRMKEET